jgi:hypothetical protein
VYCLSIIYVPGQLLSSIKYIGSSKVLFKFQVVICVTVSTC